MIARFLPNGSSEERQHSGFQVFSPATKKLQGLIPLAGFASLDGFQQLLLSLRVRWNRFSRRVTDRIQVLGKPGYPLLLDLRQPGPRSIEAVTNRLCLRRFIFTLQGQLMEA